MHQQAPGTPDKQVRIGVKYCGGCNPVIDRGELVKSIKKLLPPEYTLTHDLEQACAIGIIVCGCRTACADRPEVKSCAPDWITVAGETIDMESVSEKSLAKFVAALIHKSDSCKG